MLILIRAKAHDGEGPALLHCVDDSGTSSHAESLASILAEHRQHLDSIQIVLINQLKDVAPAIQDSITELTEEVNSMSSNIPPLMKLRSISPVQARNSGRALEIDSAEVAEITSRLSAVQLENVSASPPTLKLPQLFSLTPNSSGKGGITQKQSATQINTIETITDKKPLEQPPSISHVDNPPLDEILFTCKT